MESSPTYASQMGSAYSITWTTMASITGTISEHTARRLISGAERAWTCASKVLAVT